jgi:photosystem II stability/assembly factor-like uncharacterized protein
MRIQEIYRVPRKVKADGSVWSYVLNAKPFVVGDGIIWVVGSGQLLFSVDFGDSWRNVSGATFVDLKLAVSTAFVRSAHHIFVAGYSFAKGALVCLETRDRGGSFHEIGSFPSFMQPIFSNVPSAKTRPQLAASPLSSRLPSTACSGVVFFCQHEDGRWIPLQIASGGSPTSLSFSPDGHIGILAITHRIEGITGLPEYTSSLYRTIDRGDSWQKIRDWGSEVYNTYYSGDTLYLSGASGLFLRSNDRGESWNQITDIEKRPAYSVHFSGAEGVALCGDDNTILLYSPDSGRSWRRITLEVSNCSAAISIGNGRVLIADAISLYHLEL